RNRDFAVADIARQHLRRDLVFLEILAQFEIFDRVEKLENFLVRAIAEGAEESGREEFPAAFATVEIDVKQVVRVELDLDPRAAVGNDAEAEKNLAIEVQRRLEADARRAVKLRNDHAL